ncbi:MAG: peptidase [Frankiales bacterium]|nr:peptidase [Frankiales bacterium]
MGAVALLVTATLTFGAAVSAGAPPPAPRPTSTAASPEAPDPHPPAGGRAPNGAVPGGELLASRGVLKPAGSPPLPTHLSARAWVLTDLDSGEILAARDPHGRYQPASILKILTAITVLPRLAGKRTVEISHSAATTEGSAVGLLAGARYTVDQLFSALMLVSGNDAAMALAQAYGGKGGAAKTVQDMNQLAQRLGAYDTLVQTASGLDGWQQLTSAYDMALVLRAAVDQPRLIAYDRQLSATYPRKRSRFGKVGGYQFDNQSARFLQTVPGALLAKIGYTDAAQHTYLAAAQRNGRRLGVILLRAQRTPLDQDQQAAALLNWGFKRAANSGVGVLAGPIAATAPTTDPTTAPSGRPSSSSPAEAPASLPSSRPATASAERGRAPLVSGAVGAAVVALGTTGAVLSRTRRRARRRR